MTDETESGQDPVEEITTSEPSTPETPPISEPSLDDIIAEFAVPTPTASQPAVTPSPAPTGNAQQFPPDVDFMDADSARRFVQSVASGQSALLNQLNETKAELTQFKQREAELQVETDIGKAVNIVNKDLKLDPRIVRVHLEMTAQDKPGFKALWDQRDKNPQAFEKALGAISKELGTLYAQRQDPTLAETQAAIRQSQRTLASRPSTAHKTPEEESMANAKSWAEFDRAWESAKMGGF